MKRLWKRWLCVTLILALLAVFPLHTLGEEDVMEWTYDNSIVVTVAVDAPQQFTPEDFPEINCKRVVAVYKHESDDTEGEKRIFYSLVLVLWNSGEYPVEKAIEIAQKDPRVTHAEKNSKYEQFKSWIKLNHSEYTLKIGETVDLQIADSAIEYYADHKVGVYFRIDPSTIDDSVIHKDSFEKYGVHHFWPCSYGKYGFPVYPNLDSELEGCRSETGAYYAVADDNSPALEMADRLIRGSGVLNVKVQYADLRPGGYSPSYCWSRNGAFEIVDLPYSSSEKATTTVRGLKPGTVTVTLMVDNDGIKVMDGCVIQVVDEYQDGDINRDGDIDASDALLALQHAVRLITLDTENQTLADMDGNGKIDAADALKILQISVGILP